MNLDLRRARLGAALHAFAIVVAIVGVAVAAPVKSEDVLQRTDTLPGRLVGVDVQEQLGAQVPLDVAFRDSSGNSVTLGSYLDGKRPVVLTLNYSNCPMLCSLQLGGFVKALGQVDWGVGEHFDVVTLSIDPDEQPERAAESKARYLGQYGRDGAAEGWHFLTGDEASVRAVTNAVGFQYGYNEARKEYVHPAAIALLTPEGRVSRYLYGIEHHPKTVHLSLVESSEGRIGSAMDRLILYCFHYDSSEGRYAPVAFNVMRVAASSCAVILGTVLVFFWRAELRKKRKAQAASVAS